MRKLNSQKVNGSSGRDTLLPTLVLEAQDFAAFFEALHSRPPFPWQERLAHQVVESGWPSFLKLPTASGKTATLDIAVFHLALEAARLAEHGESVRAARRIFFVVDRCIIVNEAFERMRDVSANTAEAESRGNGVSGKLNDALKYSDETSEEILTVTARWLQWLAATGETDAHSGQDDTGIALDVVELRGGIYRDDAWVRSPLQPTIVTSTVDQFGSRLLYRGYGVSPRSWPIHAALTARDSLVILDEAHCALPFSETVQNVVQLDQNSRAVNDHSAGLTLVQMTATPPTGTDDVFKLCMAKDYRKDSRLLERHDAPKPVALITSSAAGPKWVRKLASDLIAEAFSLVEDGALDGPERRRIAVIVNRVELAREVHAQLTRKLIKAKRDPQSAELMIGAMRPIDRDELTRRLQRQFGSGSTASFDHPQFLVSTQCIEVGADLDFDGMVSQIASIDALRQRFGRLNRLGNFTSARGIIVASTSDRNTGEDDPIYGHAMARTWAWLNDECTDGTVDFGVRAFESHWDAACAEDPDLAAQLNTALEHAPTLLPAHMDQLVQTFPQPARSCDPDISLFLHGPRRPRHEVRVCWRAGIDDLLDLSDAGTERDIPKTVRQALTVVPPGVAECMTTTLNALRAWFTGRKSPDSLQSDIEGIRVEVNDLPSDDGTQSRVGAIYRPGGKLSRVDADTFNRVLPDDIVIIPVSLQGWNRLGHLPLHTVSENTLEEALGESTGVGSVERFRLAAVDVADVAYEQSRARLCLRIDESLARSTDELATINALLEALDSDGTGSVTPSPRQCDEAWKEVRDKFDSLDSSLLLKRFEDVIKRPFTVKRYGSSLAFVSARVPRRRGHSFGGFDDADLPGADGSVTPPPVTLEAHTSDVLEQLTQAIEAQPAIKAHREVLIEAAVRHDWGKADARFQANLRGVQVNLLSPGAPLLAKSSTPTDKDRRGRPRELPLGFRHEALSAELSAVCDVRLAESEATLLAHLVRSHHGYARPLFPVSEDISPQDVEIDKFMGRTARLSAETRTKTPAGYRIDSDTCADFWSVVRTQGWWGAAWLECQLRLADWSASAVPARSRKIAQATIAKAAPMGGEKLVAASITAIGIDGTNPLGYLAALGLFRVLATRLYPEVRMRWTAQGFGCWVPMYEVSPALASGEELFLDALESALDSDASSHPLIRLEALPDEQWQPGPQSAYATSIKRNSELHELDRWLVANGSEVTDPKANCQLQTARRDYFLGGVKAIVESTTRQQLYRTLYLPWDYADPIEKLTLHLEPREDRRHAQQWDRPSGDPNRKLSGGMVGANRLAIESWPLFPGKPVYDSKEKAYLIQTLGFEGHKAHNTRWIYPIWCEYVTIDTLATMMGLADLRNLEKAHRMYDSVAKRKEDMEAVLESGRRELDKIKALERQVFFRGIDAAFVVHRRLNGKTPNLSEAAPLFSAQV